MKKTIITLLAATALFSCGRQTNQNNSMKNYESLNPVKYPVSVGLGLLEPSFDLPVPLYRTINDTVPFDTLTFREGDRGIYHYETKHINSLHPYKMDSGTPYITAEDNIDMRDRELMFPSPSRIVFRVIEANDSCYCVVIDENSFETAVIRKDPDYAEVPQLSGVPSRIDMPNDRKYKGYYAYETWEHYLKRVEMVMFYGISYAVYDAPAGNMILENTDPKLLPYKVTEVRGDWMKVKKCFGREFYFEGIENAEGWVKWKDDTKILVEIVEYTVE